MALTSYDLDPVHSQLGFSVRHLMITQVHGVFTKWSGAFSIDPADLPKSQLSVEIEATSVDTRNAQRDGHLQSPDFFDVANHPRIRFVSTLIAPTATGFTLTGDFTLRGVTKSVSFDVIAAGPAKDSQGRARLGYRAQGRINRHDFGVSWSASYEGGALVVGEQVDLMLDLQLIPR
jgi:polyisoprenoid-binding protein YceI